MAWNEPGGNKPKDPWGGGGDQGPPDLDEALKNLKEKINSVFGGKGGKSGGGGRSGGGSPWPVLIIAVVIGVVVYGLVGFFQVDQRERAVVLRFGEYNRTVDPGLRWRAPIIEQYEKVDVEQNRRYEITEAMLTRDTNIVSVTLQVQYQVLDPIPFLLKVARPEVILQHATSSALRHVVGTSTMDDVLKDNREAIRVQVRERLDEYLNRYDTGLVLKQVVLDRTQAPDAVRDAFDDVSRAKEDEDRFKKEAEAYRNAVIPQARGEAKRLEEEAEAYRNRLIDSAVGDAERFSDLLTEYRKAPEVTRERLYLETMTEVYSATSKVLVDVDNGNSLIYLPLEQLVKGRGGNVKVPESKGGANPASSSSAGADDGGSGREASRSLYSTPNRELR
ncbi:MAG: FtsH protease activity modulator HflK [Alcanivorax sp.]|jgi:membrane protease subunit HflK|uniref:FtsH protease activity modulator HflK n=1 Tax=Alcanivorax sp. TaxID=1872427 RepID=UPI0019C121F0|nr:FtsH protease activity modulator HflK [Alcanivorax sp.]MBD3643113.1 FtsH protease activity modulator HflK [Alcanivorax sp.]MDF1725905.1 FtsH protease activity modulator HflK [Alcanivorax sp.]